MKVTSFKHGGGKYRVMAEINMIPLIDVSLVLLIIFMIMTPFLVRSQLKINLPSSKAASEEAQRHRTLQVQVDRSGTAYLDGQAVPGDLLESRLRQVLREPENEPVVIEADKDVAFQHVVTVMDVAKKVGATRLAVCVKKASGGGGRR
jgi:biopolymer transport protein ExbD